VAGALVSPNNITVYSKYFKQVLKAVFYSSPFFIWTR